jgi:hypothetical protein
MAQLLQRYKAGSRPTKDNAQGRWVLVERISTEKFRTGQSGEDDVNFDSTGIKTQTESGEKLEWVMPMSADSQYDFEGNEMVFEQDYGGDSVWKYRCRICKTNELICVLDRSESGHGLIFWKLGHD